MINYDVEAWTISINPKWNVRSGRAIVTSRGGLSKTLTSTATTGTLLSEPTDGGIYQGVDNTQKQ